MDIYYSPGGGFGHVTRARAFIHEKGMDTGEILILSTSLETASVLKGLNYKIIPIEFETNIQKFQSWLKELFISISASAIYIDSFPSGIIGELNGLDYKFDHQFYIARILKISSYKHLFKKDNYNFTTTFIIEKLPDEQMDFIKNNSLKIMDICLEYKNIQILEYFKYEDYSNIDWLIVHSGNDDEIISLYNYAKDLSFKENLNPKLTLISNHLPEILKAKVLHLNLYPAYPFYKYVNKIITGCGFNCINETREYRHIHSCIPFERKYDDQFFRKKNLK